jgi:UDP-N-acetylglucosamine--N-acetylmuramyl-(pentapeptide) pyrophosphoryl-undecaprenol N-acetylglucosamine transferase
MQGYFQARALLKKLRPDVIFSKGGFVSVPVVRAAGALHIPVIIHESDMTPGLANRLSIPVAKKVCCSFPETLDCLPAEKAVLTGSPIRKELLEGSREDGLKYLGWKPDERPTLLVIGGSQGSAVINRALRQDLDLLLPDFRIVHLCGKGNLDETLEGKDGYVQLEYASDELKDLFALSDLVLSRAGANSICELLALRKPNLLVPLSASSSRGDQILNAESYQRQGYSMVLQEELLTPQSLMDALKELYRDRDRYIAAMSKSSQSTAIDMIMGLIRDYA